jgi:hypothetical protein
MSLARGDDVKQSMIKVLDAWVLACPAPAGKPAAQPVTECSHEPLTADGFNLTVPSPWPLTPLVDTIE